MIGSGDRLRVVVDGRALADDSATRGIGTYLRAITTRLDRDPRLEVVHVHPASSRVPGRLAPLVHDLRLPRALASAGGDVAWSPALDPPARCRTPWVQTLHDLVPLVRDDAELEPERRRWRRRGGRVLRAAAVIAPSRWTADSAIRLLGIDPARLHVVPHGVDSAFRVPRVDAPAPYVLYVGEHGPHKGWAEAFEVAARLTDAGLPHRLVVCGRVAPWVAPAVDRLRRAARRPDRIDIAGWVPDLPARYASAAALVATSRAEGFGLPLVEAMAAGTPVVAFANSAVPEVVGEGGALVPDGDVEAFVDALVPLLRDDRAWAAASEAARARAAVFDWDVSARAHADVFLDAAGGGG